MIRKLLAAALLALSASGLAVPAFAEGRPLEPNTITGFEPFAPPGDEIRFADGTTATLRDFRGELVLATVWFTTCPSCQIEMPELQRLQETLRAEGIENIRLLPISIDDVVYRETPADSLVRVQKYYDRKGLPDLPIALDVGGGNASKLFNPDPVGTPTTFIISPAGEIVAVQQGGRVDWTSPESIAFLKSLAEG